jgi:Nuclease-related domain
MNQNTVTKTGATIKQLGRKRRKLAIAYFVIVLLLVIAPVIIYLDLGVNSLSIIIYFICLVGGVYFFDKGNKLWQAAQRANHGIVTEARVSFLLKELEEDGWEVIYNIPLRLWGDADIFLRSPSSNYFVIDLKNNSGIVFFDGSMLKLRYGTEVFPFSNNRDILKAVQGKAVELKELQGVRFVTPLVCFTKAVVEIYTDNNLVQNVYVIHADSLLEMLRKIG